MVRFGSFLIVLACVSHCVLGAQANVETSERIFSVELSSSRIIYNLGGRGEVVSVKNPQSYPILVQAWVLSEDKGNDSSFFISPPLVKLESAQSLRMRILDVKGGYPEGRESLKWFCAKGVPPSNDSLWYDEKKDGKINGIEVVTKLSVSTCTKILIRPKSLQNANSLQPEKVTWHIENNKLVVRNASPFYLNISQIDVAGQSVPVSVPVPPHSHLEFKTPMVKAGLVKWRAINDFGGESLLFESIVK